MITSKNIIVPTITTLIFKYNKNHDYYCDYFYHPYYSFYYYQTVKVTI